MIPLILQKILYITKHIQTVVRLYRKFIGPSCECVTSHNKNQVVIVEHFCCGTWRS
ncbi:hypothetical protein CUMW_275780 [Citrus unshiu]|uniref:Uncharacterized protein n=1 Tax=Citrus unshiu TaxID=55188 RepID=A0A2H5N011_CITUN|nr:hypothetical protein CUMW_275780 [Citrus unshiu]